MKLTPTLLAAAVGLALSGSAQAVHLDAGGRGQVLIYPYYTVNNHQQTLLSVTNSTSAAQAVKLRFHEGYNGREVMDFNLWLSPYDVWTGTVFALEDAGRPGQGAAISTRDRSCTSPRFFESQTVLADGTPYVSFVNSAYVGAATDFGPTNIQRTREGWIEIIAMADVTGALATAITHTGASQSPPNCAAVRPNSIIGSPNLATKPSGGLSGTASIINGGQGTLLATRAEALAGFTGVSLFTGTDNVLPNLYSVNDSSQGGIATAHRFDDNGHALSLVYGGTGALGSRPVDAVSAVLMADRVDNEFVISPALDAGSDWVLTMPTKRFYTDPIYAGSTARAPFEVLFSDDANGRSDIHLTQALYDRNGTLADYDSSGCGSVCPPNPVPPAPGYAVNVLAFSNTLLTSSDVLGSALFDYAQPQFRQLDGSLRPPLWPLQSDAGWMQLRLDGDTDYPHALPSADGKILRGLPVIGFWASNLVNGNVSNGVLANYAVAVRHATSVTCVKARDGTACE